MNDTVQSVLERAFWNVEGQLCLNRKAGGGVRAMRRTLGTWEVGVVPSAGAADETLDYHINETWNLLHSLWDLWERPRSGTVETVFGCVLGELVDRYQGIFFFSLPGPQLMHKLIL